MFGLEDGKQMSVPNFQGVSTPTVFTAKESSGFVVLISKEQTAVINATPIIFIISITCPL